MAAGWSDALRKPLAGDASERRYERLLRGDETAVLMIAPERDGDGLRRFGAPFQPSQEPRPFCPTGAESLAGRRPDAPRRPRRQALSRLDRRKSRPRAGTLLPRARLPVHLAISTSAGGPYGVFSSEEMGRQASLPFFTWAEADAGHPLLSLRRRAEGRAGRSGAADSRPHAPRLSRGKTSSGFPRATRPLRRRPHRLPGRPAVLAALRYRSRSSGTRAGMSLTILRRGPPCYRHRRASRFSPLPFPTYRAGTLSRDAIASAQSAHPRFVLLPASPPRGAPVTWRMFPGCGVISSEALSARHLSPFRGASGTFCPRRPTPVSSSAHLSCTPTPARSHDLRGRFRHANGGADPQTVHTPCCLLNRSANTLI